MVPMDVLSKAALIAFYNLSFKMTQMSHEMKKIMNKRFNVESAIDVEEIVVIDNGTDTIKIGMSGSDYPQIIIDTISGTVEQNADNDALPPRSVFFGEHLKQVL